MGRRYSADGGASIAAATTKTQWQLTAPATAAVLLHEIYCSQSTHDVSEQIDIELDRCSAAGGTPTAVTPRRDVNGEAVSSSTFGSAPGTEPTYSATPLHKGSFNTLGGFTRRFVPPLEIPPSGIIALKLVSPAGQTTFTGRAGARWEEIG